MVTLTSILHDACEELKDAKAGSENEDVRNRLEWCLVGLCARRPRLEATSVAELPSPSNSEPRATKKLLRAAQLTQHAVDVARNEDIKSQLSDEDKDELWILAAEALDLYEHARLPLTGASNV